MPLLKLGDQQVAEYQADWLQESIHKAAVEAGHEKWWFAEDVARSVIEYLRSRFIQNTITLPELFAKVKQVLESIGFHDIATKLQAEPPPLRYSFLELLHGIPRDFELALHSELQSRLRGLQESGFKRIVFHSLDQAVLTYLQRDHWDPECENISTEICQIVTHIILGPPSTRSSNSGLMQICR